MECDQCGVVKLPEEFPPETVSDKCEHAPLSCLRCTVSKVGKDSVCPALGCSQQARLTDKRLLLFQAILDTMFKEYHEPDSTPEVGMATSGTGTITVNLLTGENIQVPFHPSLTILQLKNTIQQKLKHEPHKQKLLFKEKEMTDYLASGQQSRLSDFNVTQNASVYLIILLYAVPETFDNVIFDLHWGYPTRGQDYLDATCLLFTNQTLVGVVDYGHTSDSSSAILHSGDVMDHANRIGHHTIRVSLKKIPSNVTHLFFTLSAWNSPTISHFPNPSLKFFEGTNPNKDLCKTTFHHAMHSQAIIMCSASRGTYGTWKIFESGKLSPGNAKKYQPIVQTIQELIRSGM